MQTRATRQLLPLSLIRRPSLRVTAPRASEWPTRCPFPNHLRLSPRGLESVTREEVRLPVVVPVVVVVGVVVVVVALVVVVVVVVVAVVVVLGSAGGRQRLARRWAPAASPSCSA